MRFTNCFSRTITVSRWTHWLSDLLLPPMPPPRLRARTMDSTEAVLQFKGSSGSSMTLERGGYVQCLVVNVRPVKNQNLAPSVKGAQTLYVVLSDQMEMQDTVALTWIMID